jgi:hypothetical protein
MLSDFSRRKFLGGATAFLSLAATHHGFVTPRAKASEQPQGFDARNAMRIS